MNIALHSRCRILLTILVIAGSICFPGSVQAGQEVPLNLQAAIFKKVFSMNAGLGGSPAVAIVHAPGDDAELAQAIKEFAGAGINATAVPMAGAAEKIDGFKVAYLTSGSGSFAATCAAKGKLSICGDSDLVRAGKATVGIGLSGGKPKILLKKSRVKSEGQDFNASLLSLAEVIE